MMKDCRKWKGYKNTKHRPGSIVELSCHRCGEKFIRFKWKVDEKKRKGQKVFYCSHKCVRPREDEFTPFRYLYKEMKMRIKDAKKRKNRKACCKVLPDFKVDYIKEE